MLTECHQFNSCSLPEKITFLGLGTTLSSPTSAYAVHISQFLFIYFHFYLPEWGEWLDHSMHRTNCPNPRWSCQLLPVMLCMDMTAIWATHQNPLDRGNVRKVSCPQTQRSRQGKVSNHGPLDPKLSALPLRYIAGRNILPATFSMLFWTSWRLSWSWNNKLFSEFVAFAVKKKIESAWISYKI